MDKPFNTRLGWARRLLSRNSDPEPVSVRPYGPYGVGLWTAHPIGLVIVAGLLLMGLLGIPEYRVFFAGGLALGGLLGIILWLRHRNTLFR